MARGSQNMTTFNARIITGSNSAASPAGALLLSGAGRADDATGDTWLFLDSRGGTSTPWGFKHAQASNDIEFYGSGTKRAVIHLGSNAITTSHLIGGADTWYTARTLTIGNTGKSVDGSRNVSWSLAEIGVGASGTHADSYFALAGHNHDSIYLKLSGGDMTGSIRQKMTNVTRGAKPSANQYRTYEWIDNGNKRVAQVEYGMLTNGESRLHLYVLGNNTTSTGDEYGGIVILKKVGVSGNQIAYFDANAGTFQAPGTITSTAGYLRSTLNGNTVTIGSQNTSFCHIESSANIPFWFNRSIQMAQSTVIGGAGTQYRPFQLYLGRYTTAGSNALNATNPLVEFSNSDRSQYCQLIYDDHDSIVAPDSLTLVGNQNGIFFICKNGPIWVQGGSNAGGNINRLTTSSGMPGNMQYNTSRRGTQIYSNGIAFCDPYNGNSNNDAGWIRHQETTANAGELEIAVGDDGNETIVVRQYKSNGINRTLTLLDASGNTTFPGKVTAAGGYADRTNGTATFLNYGAAGLANSAITWLTCWNGYELRAISKAEVAKAVDASHKWARIGGDTITGVLHLSYKSGTWVNSLTNSAITIDDAAGSYGGWICGPTKNGRIAISTYQYSDDILYIGYGERGRTANSFTRQMTWNGANGRLTTASVANAIWNDIAESRASDIQIPGYVIVPGEDKIAHLTTKRLQSACRIISDTYGYLLGDEDGEHAPVAIAGRVLAYPLHDKSYYEVGDAVCAAEGGKIDKMTREEIMMYPDRIIGIVNEIPDYDIWEPSREGGGREPIHTNGRIWIDVR